MPSSKFGAFFYFGLLSGFSLLLIGLLSLNYLMVSFLLGTLIICSGLGIILGAFGSTAKIEKIGEGVVLTGVAAIALTLFFVLLNNIDDKYLKVSISGDVKDVDRIELFGEVSYLGAYQNNSYNFVIFDDELYKTNLELFVYEADGSELHFKCISSSRVIPHLSSGRTIEWEFRRDKSAIYDVKTVKKISGNGGCDIANENPSLNFVKNIKDAISFFPSVYAQEILQSPRQMTTDLIGQLESDVPHVRRDARDALANQGVDAIEPLMSAFVEDPLYRTKLGALVALSGIEDARNTKVMSEQIKDDGIRALVDAVNDKDKTVRVYASEFLIKLKDPRAVDEALRKFSAASVSGKYNYVLILKSTINVLAEGEKNAILQQFIELKSVDTPKINILIEQVIDEQQ